MAKKRERNDFAENDEEDLLVPPGFLSLTSFALRRVTKEEGSDRVDVFGHTASAVASCPYTTPDVERFQTSITNSPVTCSDQFDQSAQNFNEHKDCTRASLPKGVIRGCANCHDCVKVTSRWRPSESCLPLLDDVPVFEPSDQDFKDTLKYIASIRPIAEKYGICRIVPPLSWRPPCPLQDETIWDTSKFSTEVQKFNRVKNMSLSCNLSMLRGKLEVENPEVEASAEVASSKEGMYSEEAESVSLSSESEYGPELTMKSFRRYANDFKKQYFSDVGKMVDADMNMNGDSLHQGPSIKDVEGEYWRIIENPSEEIEVLLGTSLGSKALGSGFPTKASPAKDTAEYSGYVESGWNLNNISKLSGSLLPFGCDETSTISVPKLFVGMCFASQYWRNEDHHLYTLSYMHFGERKVWYGVPGIYGSKLVEVVASQFQQFLKHPKLHHDLVVPLSPMVLMSKGIPVYRCEQKPMEFVLVFPGSYHTEFSCGFNCTEAACFAPFNWLPHGQHVVELYAENRLKTSISHDKLLLEAAKQAITAEWNSFTKKDVSYNNEQWRSISGKDGLLTKLLKSRVKHESLRMDHLCKMLKKKPFDESADVVIRRECCICFYDLYLSAVACPCSPNRYACLRHSNQLCFCSWVSRHVLYRYTISELNLLIQALEGNLSAIFNFATKKAAGRGSSSTQKDEHCAPRGEQKDHRLAVVSSGSSRVSSHELMDVSRDQHCVSSRRQQAGTTNAVQNVVVLSDDED